MYYTYISLGVLSVAVSNEIVKHLYFRVSKIVKLSGCFGLPKGDLVNPT